MIVGMQTSLTFSQHAALPDILDRLGQHYGHPAAGRRDALRQLVYMMVARGSAPSVGLAVFSRLQALYPSWARLRDANPADLAALFIGLPHRHEKVRTLPDLLQAIEEVRGALELDFLERLSTEAAQRWLETLPGVDHTLASAVLAFSTLKRASLAVDREMARPVRRLGLCQKGAPLSALERQVIEGAPASWSGEEMAALGYGLRRLAKGVCHAGRPACGECPLSVLCPSSGQTAEVLSFPAREHAVQPVPRVKTGA